MRNFRDNDRSGGGNRGGGGRGGFGGGRSGGGGRGGFGGDRGRPQMHPATCADCGNRCEVPFRPTGDKPVYCSNCFGGKDDNRSDGGRDRGGFGGGRDRGGFGGGRDRDRPQMHSATCADCGDRCEVPFKPTGAKPVFCSNCFADNQGGGSSSKSSKSKSSGVSQEQFDKLNKRLDKIMQVLERIAPPKEHVIKKEKAMPEWSEEKEVKAVEKEAKKKPAAKKKAVAKKAPAKKKAVAKKKPAAKKKVATKKKAAKKKA